MADTPIIKGSMNPVGSQTSMPVYEGLPEYAKESKHINLHKGELVQGTIIEAGSSPEEEAMVRLPTGDYSARLNGDLKRGDTLFFKVEELSPQLILKIHSVGTKIHGREIDTNEILRLLNLPQSVFFFETISFLRKKKNILAKDEVLQLYKAFSQLKDSELKNLGLIETLNILYSINELPVQFSPSLFGKLKPALSGNKYFGQLFSSFIANLLYLPNEYRKRLKNIFQKISANNLPAMINFFTITDDIKTESNEDSFFLFLKDLLGTYHNSTDNSLRTLLSNAKTMLDAMESQFLLNILAAQSNLPINIYMPAHIGNQFRVVRLIIRKGISGNKINEFTIFSETQNLGEITAKGSYYYDRLNTALISEKQEIVAFLKEHLDELAKALREQSYIIGSLKAVTPSDSTSEIQLEPQQQKVQTISVVV